MKRLTMTLLASLVMAPTLVMAADSATADFTPAQQAAIGKIAADYLLQHPEILVQVSQKLQAQQADQQQQQTLSAVLANADKLTSDPATPSYGPKDAKVAFVEFFDYQCLYCSRMAPLIEQTVKANPKVRFVFKEWPIFGDRWKESITAAETGMAVWKEKGSQAYFDYHNSIYRTGHDEGKLTNADIAAAAKAGTPNAEQLKATHEALAANDQLARTLGFGGTPGFVVIPTSGATAENTTVLPGAVSLEELQAAIVKAQGK